MSGTACVGSSTWRFLSAFSTLFIAAAGAGLLSYPYAVKQQGALLCIALTFLFGAMNIFTDYILIQTTYLFRRSLTDGRGFDSLCLHALGPAHARLASASIILGALGAQIGYLIAIGDLISAPLQAATGCPASSAPMCALTSRAFLIPALAFCMLPLTSLSSAHSLGHSSALAVATVLAVCGVVAAQGVGALARGGFTVVGSTGAYPSQDSPSALVLSRWTMSAFLGIPISVFSLGNHMQIILLYKEASPALQARFPAVVMAAVGSCVALYLTTGLLGYAAFGAATQGDIMLNLPSNGATATGKVLLAVHLLMSYPVLFLPSRRSLLAAAGDAAAWLRGRAGGGGALAALCEYLSTSAFAIPLVATALSALLAVAAPSISVVFGLLGATVATYQIYGIPGILLLRFAAALEGKSGSSSSSSSGGSMEETWATVPAIWARGGEAAALLLEQQQQPLSEGDDEGAAPLPPPNLLPLHSAALTRALAWMLLGVGTMVGACGTVVYILSTWAHFG